MDNLREIQNTYFWFGYIGGAISILVILAGLKATGLV